MGAERHSNSLCTQRDCVVRQGFYGRQCGQCVSLWRRVQQAMPVTSLSVALSQRADAKLGGLRTSTDVVRSFLED